MKTSFSKGSSLFELGIPFIFVALCLMYFGISLGTAVVAAAMWCSQGVLGALFLRKWVPPSDVRKRVGLLLGPGPLFGLGLVTALYLLVRGGALGNVLVTVVLVLGVAVWSRISSSTTHLNFRHQTETICMLIAMALFANINELPNFILPSLGVLLVFFAIRAGVASPMGVITAGGGVVVLAISAIARPIYWWVNSDDTTTLAGIGTTIIQRGRIEDIAGWPTSSHHWFLQAWLGLWNSFSNGHIFKTYLIAVPIVLTLSIVASLWLLLEVFLGRSLEPIAFAITAGIVTGVARVGWPAPHQQHPFFFAMVAMAAMWLTHHAKATQRSSLRSSLIGATTVMLSALFFIFLKPSLLAALGLIIIGMFLVNFQLIGWPKSLFAVGASIVAVAAGLVLMHFGSAWVSEQSFTTIAVDYFPLELGWCAQSSLISSVWCVISLQFPLFTAFLFAIALVWLNRSTLKLNVSTVLLIPLIIAYFPFRFFVSFDVDSGAASFNQLGELGVVTFIAVVLAATLTEAGRSRVGVITLLIAGAAITFSTGLISRIDDVLGPKFSEFGLLRFLPVAAVITLSLAIPIALAIVQLPRVLNVPFRHLVAVFVVASALPVLSLVQKGVTTDTLIDQSIRPEFLGPPDIERVSTWIHDNTTSKVLLATNFLCEKSRLGECTRVKSATQCPKDNPQLMASWALTALSERDFLYLSQNWFDRSSFYLLHDSSTRLSNSLDVESIRQLQSQNVTYFVASKDHTQPQVWEQLIAVADFVSENFAVVNLATLFDDIQA